MKFYREFLNNIDLTYKESLALCIMLNKNNGNFKFDTKEFCQLLDCGRTTCFSILKKLKRLGYINKKGKAISVCVEKLNCPNSYIYISQDLLLDKSLLPLDKIIYSGLKSLLSCKKTDENGEPCVYCSVNTIATKLNCCRDNVFSSINRLMDKKLLVKFKLSSRQNRYYIADYVVKNSEKIQNIDSKTSQIVQNIDTDISSSYISYKENKEKIKISKNVANTKSSEEQKVYFDFINRFTNKLGIAKIKLTKYLTKLIDNFFTHYNFDELEIILDKIIKTDYLNTGSGKWVKNIYHFLQNDVFIKIFTGFYDKFKLDTNNVKITNKFNSFNQRKYSDDFLLSLYDNIDVATIVPLDC